MKYIYRMFFLSLLITCFTFGDELQIVTVDNLADDAPDFAGYVSDQIVLKLNESILKRMDKERAARSAQTGIDYLDRLNRRFAASQLIQKYPHLKAREYQGRIIDPKTWFIINFSRPIDPQQVAREYRLLDGILDAQPIGVHKVHARTPNDGQFSSQWHLNQGNDADIDAPEAYDIEAGSEDIIVAILDTGVRYYHKDLGGANASPSNVKAARGNMWINQAELNGSTNVDDDQNGFVDDWIGWDFVTGKSGVSGEDVSTPDNDPRDFNGHGSHTTGIVTAINNNGLGVASVAGGWNNGSQAVEGNGVKVMPLRIGWSGRYFIFEVGYVDMGFAANAFYYAADNGARLASCSWGSSNSGGLGEAIDYFLAGGGLIFKSAGNNSNESTDFMTARSDIIAVAATNSSDSKADFSSYGTWVDISAPGENILSTYHDHTNANNDVYASLSGTSMASPMAAGVAALIWSKHPDWTASQVRQRLYDTADDFNYGSYAGKLGAGRINAYNAVNDGSGPSAPLANFSASPTSGCAPLMVNFTNQSSGEITSYFWDFGDGGTSTAQNPSHSYATSGLFSISLTVTGPGGSDTETKTNFISVLEPVTAQFIGSPTSGEASLTVNFTDQSSGDVTSWSWDFGDGGTSSSQNPSHQYTTAGIYTVLLTVSNSCSNDSETKVNYITVTEPSGNAPVAQFSGSPTSGNAPLTVNFTDQSTNNPSNWSWDFGDGATSGSQNPSHIYHSPGTYSVSLTATNDFGSDTETKVNYITVNEVSQNRLHVSEVTVTKQSLFRFYQGVAKVRIVDASGAPVASATVNGKWSGATSDNDQVTTGSDGYATANSDLTRTNGTFTFCVNNVSKSGWTYDDAANVVTCGSSDGSSSAIIMAANVTIDELEKELGFKLATNNPNPFNPSTTITFYIPEAAQVKVDIYNIMGQLIKTLYDGQLPEGFNSVRWEADDELRNKVSSGFYFYQIMYDQKQMLRRKILLLK